MADNKVIFTTDDGEQVEFTVIDEAKLGGINYLLVVENESDEDAYILMEVKNENGDSVYEIIEDEEQLIVLMDYFNELMDDIDLEM